jgi:thiol-disulfide isomerase/thioredoxin
VIAIAAVIVSSSGDSANAGPQTRPVEISGNPLPTFDPNANPDPGVGQQAPTLNGSTFDGTPVSITNDGRPKVVMFIAHWCPHCQAEVPRITQWLKDNGMPSDVDLYAVATGTSADAPNYPPSRWLEKAGWPVTTMADDENSSAAKAYGLSAYPYFVALDASGRVVVRTSGELTMDQFEAVVSAVVSGSTSPR